jgi:hypothetical protein
MRTSKILTVEYPAACGGDLLFFSLINKGGTKKQIGFYISSNSPNAKAGLRLFKTV